MAKRQNDRDQKSAKRQEIRRQREQRAAQSVWLEGPQVPGQYEDPMDLSPYPGKLLGLPESGAGSIASLAPRLLALLIDWTLSWGIAALIVGQTDALGDTSTATMMIWILLRIITVWLFAQSPGHAIVGIGVARVDDPEKRVGFVRAAVRAILTIFLFPPIIQDTDGRGMHDRATGTAVIRTR